MKLLLWLITILYFTGGAWWYVVVHKKAGKEIPEEDSVHGGQENPNASEPYLFQWSGWEETLNPGFNDFRDSIVKATGSKNLEITGHYFSEEENSTLFHNLGLARADRIRHLFSSVLNSDQFILKSEEMILKADTMNRREGLFKAVTLRILDRSSDEMNGRTVINFNYASDDLLLDPEMESYLEELVDRLNSSDERLLIVGHADNTAGEKRNTYLGYKRAQSVSEKIIALGLDREKIILESRGEAEPAASNDTPEGRKKNRRVEIFIIPT